MKAPAKREAPPIIPADVIREIAKAEGLPITGITILGGRPYVNVSGLDAKMKEKAQKEGLIISKIAAEPIGEEVPEGPGTEVERRMFGYRGIVEFFDKGGFLEALSRFENPSEEILKTLRDMFTYRFEDEGWASALTCEAIAYRYEGPPGNKRKAGVLIENVKMMAARKATNRAKRSAVGCGLTSVEEVGVPSEEAPTGDFAEDLEDLLTEIQKLSSASEAKKWGEENKEKIQSLPKEMQDKVKDAWLLRMGEFTDGLVFEVQKLSSLEELETWKKEKKEEMEALPSEDRKVVEKEIKKKEASFPKETGELI